MRLDKKKDITMKRAKKLADDAMSRFIRKRDKGMCKICGIRPVECNYHIFPRENMPTRWSAMACLGSCKGCNFNEFIDRRAANKARLRDIYIKLLGLDLYTELETMSKGIAKFSKAEILEIASVYDRLTEELEDK